jgi:aspartyl-tRNA(Asn)/glutamyl-tRNA(Gln) amidotransferase subunit A
VSLKDLFDVAGQPTRAGGVALPVTPAATDAAVWRRLKRAGALLLGKTNMHEYAYGATTINRHTGDAHNPWALDRVPGGSSGGGASAVAAGLGYASIGSDTGGSIRCPAALTNVTGLKPTYGRVSRAGAFPLSWAQDHVGPLTRTVMDSALVLDAIGGSDSADSTTLGVPRTRLADGLRAAVPDLRGRRIGLLVQHRALVLEHDVGMAFDRAVDDLRALGAEVVDVEMPEEQALLDAGVVILTAEATAVHLPYLREQPESYGADVRGRLERGALVPAVDYIDAQRARGKLTAAVLERFATLDAVVGPAVPIAAPPIGATTIRMGNRDVDPRTVLLRATRVFDVTGQPALSVPCGFTADGLPVGLQVVAAPWREDVVLHVAHVYQQQTRWHTRRPPLDAPAA